MIKDYIPFSTTIKNETCDGFNCSFSVDECLAWQASVEISCVIIHGLRVFVGQVL